MDLHLKGSFQAARQCFREALSFRLTDIFSIIYDDEYLSLFDEADDLSEKEAIKRYIRHSWGL